jgi:nucleotide sugar dehydrogenase
MKVCVIGCGYVGLTLAVYLAKQGHDVHGVDVSDTVLASLESGHAHFYEKDFDGQLADVIKSGHFHWSRDIPEISDTVCYIVTVGTPLASNDKVNLVPIGNVCESLREKLKDGDMVVLRSTVKVGVTRNIVKPALDCSGKKYYLAFCPERTLEGCAFEELASLPQIVSGIDDESLTAVAGFFAKVCSEIVLMGSVEEAEMVKLLNNSERDLMFALANEIALMCDGKGLDVHRIIAAANHNYPRSNLKKPGPVGGPCLEKDPYILTEGFEGSDYVPNIFLTGRRINESIAEASMRRTKMLCDELGRDVKKIAVLGFAFKGLPPTGDMRGSPVFDVLASIRAYFPQARLYGHDYLALKEEVAATGVITAETVREAVEGAQLVIIQNNHPDYRQEPLDSMIQAGAVIFDFWNQFDPEEFSEATYLSLGRFGNSNKREVRNESFGDGRSRSDRVPLGGVPAEESEPALSGRQLFA